MKPFRRQGRDRWCQDDTLSLMSAQQQCGSVELTPTLMKHASGLCKWRPTFQCYKDVWLVQLDLCFNVTKVWCSKNDIGN